MPKSIKRTYSQLTKEAIILLAGLIRCARKQGKLTLKEVALRAGISRGLLQRIEKGDPKCEIGVVFEVATIVNVNLFEPHQTTLRKHIHDVEEKLTLLPKSIRGKIKDIDDDF